MNIFMYIFRNKPLNFSKALEAALVQGVIGTSGHLSDNVYERIITFIRKNVCAANRASFIHKNDPKKWHKKILLSYKRVLQKFNLNEKTLLKVKAEEPIAELSDVTLPSFMSCEDELRWKLILTFL